MNVNFQLLGLRFYLRLFLLVGLLSGVFGGTICNGRNPASQQIRSELGGCFPVLFVGFCMVARYIHQSVSSHLIHGGGCEYCTNIGRMNNLVPSSLVLERNLVLSSSVIIP